MAFLERFLKFFGGGVLLSLIPLVVAVVGEGDRGWNDVLYTGPLVIIGVAVAAAALLEAATADVKSAGGPWQVLKIVALVCAACVVIGGAMLYQQYSDNDQQESRFDDGMPGADEPPDRGSVAAISYVVTAGALLAGVGSTAVATRADK